MKQLEHRDSFHVTAAQGWLELGDPVSASDELEQITPELKSHPDVLLVRCEIYSKAKRWDFLARVAETLVKAAPERREGWIHRSYALHALERTQEALDNLLPAAKRFPREYLIPYNLACYCAQLGHIEEAEDWFKQAMAIDEQTVKRVAIEDPDLEPLWEGMQGSSWNRTK